MYYVNSFNNYNSIRGENELNSTQKIYNSLLRNNLVVTNG